MTSHLIEAICVRMAMYACALHCIATCALADPSYQGVSLVVDQSVNSSLLDESILNLKRVGANTVAVDLNWRQPSLSSVPLVEGIDEVLAEATTVVRAVKQRGLDVFLRSNVVVDGGAFSGRIDPQSSTGWFASYGSILERVSTFADEQSVSLLSIGSNLNQLEAEEYDSDWRSLVENVRTRFSGKVTYAADVAENVGGGFRELNWWDSVDVIAVNAYLPLTFDFNGVPEELVDGARSWADDFAFWLEDTELQQKILFADIGYRSQDGGAVFPLERAGDRVDLLEQAYAYEAIHTAFDERTWWDGAIWAGWHADPHAGGPGDNGFSPQGKPAERVLAQRYGGRPNPVLRRTLLESWEDGFNGWRLPNSPPSATGALEISAEEGNTEGAASLSIPSGNGRNLSAAKIWTLDGSEAYSLFQLATSQSEKYSIELDATLAADQVGNLTASTLLLSLQDDADRPTVVNLPMESNVMEGASVRLSVPLADFGDLNPDSLYYELQLGSNNAWNGSVLVDNLRLVSNVSGDVSNDAIVNCDDIDVLNDAIRHGWSDQQFDLDQDGLVNDADRAAWIVGARTLAGDSDLNGKVEFADFLVLADSFSQPGNWCEGDANGDREVNFADFLLLSTNFGQDTTPAATVPEPSNVCGLVLLLLYFARCRKCPLG